MIARVAVESLADEFSESAANWRNIADKDRREGGNSSILGVTVPSHVLSTVRAQIWEAAAKDARALLSQTSDE
jgi:hypothetical protein